MMNKTPSGMKKHHESTKPESRQTAKMSRVQYWHTKADQNKVWSVGGC